MLRLSLILLTVLLLSLPAFGQLDDADEATKAKCVQSLKISLPAESASIPTPGKFPGCNSYKFYAGIGTATDFTTARHCAWSERLATLAGVEPRDAITRVFGGSAMLTVLYANGDGVERNLPLAIRFACEAGGSPAEIGGRVKDLEDRIDTPKTEDSKFNFCDATTSGFMMGFCSSFAEEKHASDRDARLTRMAQAWTAHQKESFARVLLLQAKYAEAHARGEIDLSGTARAMYQIDAESSLKDDFMEALKAFEAGEMPNASAAEAVKADEELNRAYLVNLQTSETHKAEYGAVQPHGIRQAERAWIQYRDAWLDFAAMRYPSVERDAWQQLLTANRTLILAGKSCGALEECDGEQRWSPRPLP